VILVPRALIFSDKKVASHMACEDKRCHRVQQADTCCRQIVAIMGNQAESGSFQCDEESNDQLYDDTQCGHEVALLATCRSWSVIRVRGWSLNYWVNDASVHACGLITGTLSVELNTHTLSNCCVLLLVPEDILVCIEGKMSDQFSLSVLPSADIETSILRC
jgi:hypothetical protein